MMEDDIREREKHTRNTNKLPRPQRDQLLLKQTRPAALDTVQIRINLIRPVKRHIQHRRIRQIIKQQRRQPRRDDDLARLVARGHEADARIGAGANLRVGGLDVAGAGGIGGRV